MSSWTVPLVDPMHDPDRYNHPPASAPIPDALAAGRISRWGQPREFARFVLVRGACAVVTYMLYLVLLLGMRYEIAYVISFVVGVALAYVANAAFVFRTPMRKKAAIQFPIVYVFQFVVTLILLRVAVENLGIPKAFALAAAVAFTLPITYFLSRLIFRSA